MWLVLTIKASRFLPATRYGEVVLTSIHAELECHPQRQTEVYRTSNNKRRNARGDQPNNVAPLFMTLCLTSVPTRNGRAYDPESNQPTYFSQPHRQNKTEVRVLIKRTNHEDMKARSLN